MNPDAVDANAPAQIQERMRDPETATRLLRLLDRMESMEDALDTFQMARREGPHMVGAITDTVDELAQQAHDAGIDLNVRSTNLLTLLERLSAPETTKALTLLMDRSEELQQALDMAFMAPQLMAMAADTADELAQRAHDAGINVNDRAASLLTLLEKVSAPETASTLALLLSKSQELEEAINVATMAPQLVAMATDTADEVVHRMQDAGIDINQRMGTMLKMMEMFTSPDTTKVLELWMSKSDEVYQLVGLLMGDDTQPGFLNDEALQTLSDASKALFETQQTPQEPLGFFGLMRVMGDSDVQRAIGFIMGFLKSFGKAIAVNQQNRKQLGS